MAQETTVRERIADKPKLVGALWALTLLLAEAGPVLAASSGGKAGP